MTLDPKNKKPGKFHLDSRAFNLIPAATEKDPDACLSTREVARWLGVSTQWLEIKRSQGGGPAFTKIAPRCVRYRLGDVLEWLRARVYAATDEYRSAENGQPSSNAEGSL